MPPTGSQPPLPLPGSRFPAPVPAIMIIIMIILIIIMIINQLLIIMCVVIIIINIMMIIMIGQTLGHRAQAWRRERLKTHRPSPPASGPHRVRPGSP